MDLFFLISKIVIVAFFLLMFLRSGKMIWGVGLLAVTSAILLDTFLGTFGREEMIEQLGFFFYVFAGALFAGAAIWLVGVIKPHLSSKQPEELSVDQPESTPARLESPTGPSEEIEASQTPHDHQATSGDINDNFTADNVLDLAFDMSYNDLLESSSELDKKTLLRTVFARAEEEGHTDELELAVERIQNPLPPDHLPRIEKITSDSPPTVLRQYMVQNITGAELESLATDLEIEWPFNQDESTNAKVRFLLISVEKNQKTKDLIDLMRVPS
jgi:hypothetical protein